MNDFSTPITRRVNFQWYLAFAASWVHSQERFILKRGVPLTADQLSDARLVGVANPEHVRLLRVEEIPLPERPELRAMAEAMDLNGPSAPGLTLRYGIYIRSEFWGKRDVVVHKLAHTAQYERLGGARTFLECYLYQCLAVGKAAAPLEQEATDVARRICEPTPALNMPQVGWPAIQTDPPPIKRRRIPG
jgi:hypothetical protein